MIVADKGRRGIYLLKRRHARLDFLVTSVSRQK